MNAARPTGATLADVVGDAELIVTCGPGGVGKTTTSAALGMLAAQAGRRVVVVTIDPARRLANALGIDATSNDPHLVEGAVTGPGSLWALMLDAESTFDRLIVERAGDRAEALLENPVYRSIAGALGGAQEYMAIERLHQLHTSGEFDLVVIDTPPSRHAIDVLEAPERLVRFLSHPVYRALTIPTRSLARVTHAASSAFLWTVKRLAGPQIVQDTIEFFRALAGVEAGLRARAAEMAELLRDERTAFVLVSSPRAEAIDEASFLAEALADGGFRLGAVVVNLVHPLPPALGPELGDGHGGDDGDGDGGAAFHGALGEQVAYHRELTELATAERDEIATLAALAGAAALCEVPLLDHDVHDVAALAELGRLLGTS